MIYRTKIFKAYSIEGLFKKMADWINENHQDMKDMAGDYMEPADPNYEGEIIIVSHSVGDESASDIRYLTVIYYLRK